MSKAMTRYEKNTIWNKISLYIRYIYKMKKGYRVAFQNVFNEWLSSSSAVGTNQACQLNPHGFYIEGFFLLWETSGPIYVFFCKAIAFKSYIEGKRHHILEGFLMWAHGTRTRAFLVSAKVTHQFHQQRILAGAWMSRWVGWSYREKVEVASGRKDIWYRWISTYINHHYWKP